MPAAYLSAPVASVALAVDILKVSSLDNVDYVTDIARAIL
jgi:hypothetical protein